MELKSNTKPIEPSAWIAQVMSMRLAIPALSLSLLMLASTITGSVAEGAFAHSAQFINRAEKVRAVCGALLALSVGTVTLYNYMNPADGQRQAGMTQRLALRRDQYIISDFLARILKKKLREIGFVSEIFSAREEQMSSIVIEQSAYDLITKMPELRFEDVAEESIARKEMVFITEQDEELVTGIVVTSRSTVGFRALKNQRTDNQVQFQVYDLVSRASLVSGYLM